MVNLLLDGLRGYFKKSAAERERTDAMYAALKDAAGETADRAAARAAFERQLNVLEASEQETLGAVEYAFDFMERAFLNGQEMVVFVTELAMDGTAALFLAEHACERYTRYGAELLIGTKKAELLSEIERNL